MAELLNNRYRIIKSLGSGGCGQTFLAEDEYTFHSKCVVKQFKPIDTDPETYRIIQDRFQREAAILKKVGDNNRQIPTLYAYLIQDQEFYLVQEWIEGFNLKQKVERDGPFTPAEVKKFLVDILPVLTYIHSQGIIHRDIKPENILTRVADGKPVLIDFGAVKEIATTNFTNQRSGAPSIIIGSLDYMPLEQSAGKPVFASDLYSLGVTAIYLLTGKRPRDMRDLKSGNYAWRAHAENVDNELAAVLDKAIQQMPSNRYQTADEMLAALGPDSETTIIRPRGDLRPKKGESSMTSSSRSLLSILGAVLVILGIAFFAYWYSSKEPQSPNINSQSPSAAPGATVDSGRNVLRDIRKRNYLIMGVQWYSPPMNYSPKDEDFTPGEGNEEERRDQELNWDREGFDYELANMIAARLGLQGKKMVRAREVLEFEELFPLVNRKEKNGDYSVDIIMSGISRDPKYDDTISWSIGYVEFGYALIAKKSSYIEDLDDCKDRRIGIVKGDNVVKAYVSEKLPNAQIVELSDEENGWTNDALNLDKVVDAIIYDYPFAVVELNPINQIKEDAEIKGETLEMKKTSLPDSYRTYNIGVAKGNDELLEKINDAIKEIRETQRYADLVRKYMSPPPGTVKQATPAGGRLYIVKVGDSLSKIALAELGDANRWPELRGLNNIPNEHVIFKGQRISLPKE